MSTKTPRSKGKAHSNPVQDALIQGGECITLEINALRLITGLAGLDAQPPPLGQDIVSFLRHQVGLTACEAETLTAGVLAGQASRARVEPDGGARGAVVSALPRMDATGCSGAVMVIARADEAPTPNTDAEERLNAILDNAADAILVISTDGVIENANRAATTLTEWPVELLIGQPLTVLMGAADGQGHQARLARYLRTGQSGILNVGPRPLNLMTRGGVSTPIELSVGEAMIGGAVKFIGICRDIRDRLQVEAALTMANDRLQGQVHELRALGRDLAERKQAQQKLTREAQSALRIAEHANQAKSRFMATMSHELRTPLNGVLAVADALSKRPLPPQDLELVKLIKSSGEGLLSILNEVLDLARVEAGALVLDLAPISPLETVTAVADIWRFAAEAKGLQLTTEITNLPDLVVGDAKRLRQVLSNLISNAIKFTTRGAVHLAAIGGPEPGRLVFSVGDSGPGIKPHQRERLFEPFVQADATTTRRHGGTGLGLAICRELITLMGGRIWAEAAPGGGAILQVEVTLPIASAVAPTDPDARHNDPLLAANFDPLILVAEDHPLNRRVIAILLDEAGLRYEFAEDGEAAVKAVACGRFDLVLMDVHMPRLDGLAATRRIRALGGERGAVPIVAVTANASSEEIAECLSAGMNDFVGKPISAEALFTTILRRARV